MGRTGNFDGVDIIDIVLDQPATARFITAKLYRYFAAEEAPPALIEKLATIFRDHDYAIKPLLHAMFLARDFYGPAVVATQIKSPVQLAISTYAKLGLSALPGVPDFHAVTESLGQKLLYPPNVAGWEGGRSWITPASLVERGNFAKSVLFPPVGEFIPPERALTKIWGISAPAAARIVGTISMLLHSSDRSAGFILPGQRNMIGVRVPPSYGLRFERAAYPR